MGNLFRFLFYTCKHDWEVKDKTVLPSVADQINEHGQKIDHYMGPQVYRRRVALVMVCKRCGKVYKSVEENP